MGKASSEFESLKVGKLESFNSEFRKWALSENLMYWLFSCFFDITALNSPSK